MMKKIFLVVVSMVMTSFAYAQDTSLMNYVPKDANGFVCINVQDALCHPKIRELIDSPKDYNTQIIEMKKTFQDNGVDIYKACSAATIYYRSIERRKGEGGGVIKTTVNEKLLNTMLEKDEKTKGKVKKLLVNGRTIYSVPKNKGGGDDEADSNGEETFFSYAAPDILLIANKKDEIIKIMAMKEGEKVSGNLKLMDLSSKIDKNSTVWGVFEYNAPEMKKGQDGAGQMFPVDSISGGSAALKLMGEKKDVIRANVKINCKEQLKAQMLTMQMQGMVAMAIPAISRGNAKLMDELTKVLKFGNEGNDIIINMEFTPSVIDGLKKASENMVPGMQPGMEDGDDVKVIAPEVDNGKQDNPPADEQKGGLTIKQE